MRFALVLLCVVLSVPSSADGQTSDVPALRFAVGTIVTFHVQSRLRPEMDDTLNGMPQGTAMQVKLLDAIDSTQNRYCSSYRGTLKTTTGSTQPIAHSQARVRGSMGSF